LGKIEKNGGNKCVRVGFVTWARLGYVEHHNHVLSAKWYLRGLLSLLLLRSIIGVGW
jgi:hypothetical protein